MYLHNYKVLWCDTKANFPFFSHPNTFRKKITKNWQEKREIEEMKMKNALTKNRVKYFIISYFEIKIQVCKNSGSGFQLEFPWEAERKTRLDSNLAALTSPLFLLEQFIWKRNFLDTNTNLRNVKQFYCFVHFRIFWNCIITVILRPKAVVSSQ